jgi:hypothetical protein
MKTDLNAFDDYKDKMNKLANAHEATSYHLKQMAGHLEDVSMAHKDIADSFTELSNGIRDVKESMLPDLSVN